MLQSEINPFIRGFSNQLLSSSHLGWKDISVEIHEAEPGVRNEGVARDHLIVVPVDCVIRGEKLVSPNRYIPEVVPPGVLNLYPVGPIPACRLFAPAKMIVSTVSAELVKQVSGELESPTVSELRSKLSLRDESLRGILLLLAAEAKSGGKSGQLYVEHLSHAFVLRLLRLSGEVRVGQLSRRGKLPDRMLQRVLERMKTELATDLDLNTLVAESGYSRTHFLRMFRATMGCSPYQWLTRLRMEQAKTLLRDKSLRLIDIAIACGFSSNAQFSNRFHQIVGVTPSLYRREIS